jgi:peptidoglycan hydrolase-like protein with peptidoglycan-binding domain
MNDMLTRSPTYAGIVLENGILGSPEVRLLQARLNDVLGNALVEDGDFGVATEDAVRLFQARYADPTGMEIEVDGRVGPETWAALFGAESVGATKPAAGDTRGRVLAIARSQIGVCEIPVGSNRGPQVDAYHRAAGLDPNSGDHPWCVSFVQWVFRQAFDNSPLYPTAGVHALWKQRKIGSTAIVEPDRANARTVRPGMVFALDTGGGKGHAGIVEDVDGARGTLLTLEGNTNNGGSREGYGVFRRRSRKIAMPRLLGYIDYCT